MRDIRINYAVVGGFVLVMLAAMLVVVALLTGRTGGADTYYTHFRNVSGIKYGSKVSYEGFVIGLVDEISPERDGDHTTFKVRLAVRSGWNIPQDSVARTAAAGFLAAMNVDIRGGTSPEMLKPGSEIHGGSSANLFAVMADVAGQMGELNQTALKPLLATLAGHIDKIGGLLEKQAPELLANLMAVSGDLAQKTPKITADVSAMTGRLNTQVLNETNAKRMSESMENMVQLSRGLEDSRRKLDTAITTLDKVVTGNRDTIDASLKDLRYTLQTVARNIDSVTYNLEGTTRNFNEFSRQLRDNPGVLIGGRRNDDGPDRR